MTMLDRMRRHKGWLKWSLGLVVVAFILLYVPDFLSQQPGAGGAAGDVIAEVEGQPITTGEFRRVYQAQLQSYRNAYGANINEQLLRQLGIDQQILQQMIDEQAALAEARRLRIRVSDAELRERIVTLPVFQEHGRFIGDRRYEQLLRMQRMRPDEFEEGLRRSLVVEKLRAALTDWVVVGDEEVEQEFRRRNERVQLETVVVEADAFREDVTATDEEVAARFEADPAAYRIPERRRIRFVAIDLQAIREGTQVRPSDVERHYNINLDQYSSAEQVRARHILLRVGEGEDEGAVGEEDEAAVRKAAEALAARARAGADFAELARRHSQDEASAVQGGDLGFFARGRMVPEFEAAAFDAEPGTVTDPVRTQYGYHVIKVEETQPAVTRSLEEARPEIEEQLRWEQAQAEATRLAEAVEADLRRPADLDRVAERHGLTVQESDFFQREEPVPGIGPAPEVNARAFELSDTQLGGPIRTPQGYVFFAVSGRQPAYVPTLDEVRERVREDVVAGNALEAARERAASLLPGLRRDFAKTARGADLEVEASELIARGTPLPGLGVSPEVEAAAFALPAGSVSDPILADAAAVVVRVVEREDVTPEQVAAGLESLRRELVAERQNRFFSAYMNNARQRMRIQIHREVLRQVVA